MIKKIKSFFTKAKKSKSVVGRVRKVVNPTDYFGLNRIEIVKKACYEYDKIHQQFTVNMIWKYLNGLLGIFSNFCNNNCNIFSMLSYFKFKLFPIITFC